jgi:asparagine synthase (glutamine-hydrolysing)
MCGFAAIIDTSGGVPDAHALRAMTDSIRHRGPDDEGFHVRGPVGFGFRRLSILDLTPAGHQPMESEDGGFVLVYNGEIFNYVELRTELVARGHRFRSTGDTEVLLHAYMEWGADCLPRLNGMWAFLIHDIRRGVVFGSRDRFGIKPLYRFRGPNCIVFGSEIKAVRASGAVRGGPDAPMISRFLHGPSLDLLNRRGETFFEGIEEVPAGTAFEIRPEGCERRWRYWSLPDPGRARDSGGRAGSRASAAAAEEYASLLEDAVRIRMRSDVPVGVALSGGLDSTAVICAMARVRGPASEAAGRLNAFSYIAEEFDESLYIDATLAQTDALLHRIDVDPLDLWNRLPTALRFHDEPVHTLNALIGFDIYARAAAHGIRVMLNGQGADECVGGYPSYFDDLWVTLLRQGRFVEGRREIAAYTAAHGGDARATYRDALLGMLSARARGIPAVRSLLDARRARNTVDSDWFSPETRPPRGSGGGGRSTLDQALRWSVEAAPLPFYLRVEDRNSMAHSVEARVPFMDHRLVSFSFTLPDAWKLHGPWNKWILREALRGRVPEVVRTRLDKMGFPIPLREWVAGPLYEPIQDLLASRAARERGLYDIDAIRRDHERHRRGETDVAKALLNVAQLEVWYRTVADAPPPTRPPS